jgi:hypothetical protein
VRLCKNAHVDAKLIIRTLRSRMISEEVKTLRQLDVFAYRSRRSFYWLPVYRSLPHLFTARKLSRWSKKPKAVSQPTCAASGMSKFLTCDRWMSSSPVRHPAPRIRSLRCSWGLCILRCNISRVPSLWYAPVLHRRSEYRLMFTSLLRRWGEACIFCNDLLENSRWLCHVQVRLRMLYRDLSNIAASIYLAGVFAARVGYVAHQSELFAFHMSAPSSKLPCLASAFTSCR